MANLWIKNKDTGIWEPVTTEGLPVENKVNSVTKVVDNTTIAATVTGADIDLTGYTNFMVSYFLAAAATGTPTCTITLQFKDSSGNYITDPDYATAALSVSTSGVAFKGYLEAYSTVRVIATLGGTGTFATGCTINFKAKS